MSGGYHTLFYFDLCEREREGGVTGVGEKEGEKGEEREKGIWIRERSGEWSDSKDSPSAIQLPELSSVCSG